MDVFERFHNAIESLLADRRPRRMRVSPEERDALRMAARLRAARPGADEPRPEFLAELRRRIHAELGALPQDEPLSRRRIVLGWAASLIATVGLTLGIDRRFLPHPPTQRRWPRVPIVPEEIGHWELVARLEEVPVGAVRKFVAGALQGYLFNEDGQFRAISAACTDVGCTLVWRDSQQDLWCPCHGAAFDPQGAMIEEARGYEGFRLRSLPAIRVKVEDEAIYVWTVDPVEPPPDTATA
jgi:Rieske Fe-S protein